MPEMLTAEDFEPHVGTPFAFAVGASTTDLVLATVLRFPTREHGERRAPFSLIFLGSTGDPLPQATYDVTHAGLDGVGLFVVPIGPDTDGRQRYEAVFN